MFNFKGTDVSSTKCYATHGFTFPEAQSTRRRPLSTIHRQNFTHTVDLILPERLCKGLEEHLNSKLSKVKYSRVILPLTCLLEGDFFNNYIKTGNVLMISEGRPGVDRVYSLCDGILRLELPKDIYERTGLTGKPISDGGKKHSKVRYVVEINLRLPSMVHGRKGFERLVWACNRALVEPVTWLVCDLNAPKMDTDVDVDAPIAVHHPVTTTVQAAKMSTDLVLVPPLSPPDDATSHPGYGFQDYSVEVHEWLGLVALGSSRVRPNDSIDPYLCRYEVPDLANSREEQVTRLQWRGLLPAKWIAELYSLTVKTLHDVSPDAWFALNAGAFELSAVTESAAYTIMLLPYDADAAATRIEQNKKNNSRQEREYLVWEMTGIS
ncbi:hypothetical protein L228DRAFT_150571 [Xylona heveae TC161]|uniref:Uncharacterized protein n=1 Tax=Xylona heveae (strain CBS 132557 / TC161) TaxID=1328760 RepID=A0A165GL77_XYLHT|nr:hypothetical protein L228DRAFT_150571 [Xylona heveae TC161]KZF22326.1 hypothetical protein L228DRAFT_150571 [Xylona heveae TC161]